MKLKKSLIFILILILTISCFPYANSNANAEVREYSINYPNTQNVFVPSDLENDYYIANYLYNDKTSMLKIIKHNVKNNTNEEIYTLDGLFSDTHYVRGSIIYIEALEYNEYDEGEALGVRIIGFNTSNNSIVYDNTFSDLSVKGDDYYHSFVVDSKENVYFEYEYTGIKVINKEKNVIYEIEPENNLREYEIVLHSISPNDDGMMFSLGEYFSDSYLKTLYQGYQKLNSDGTFVYDTFTVFDNAEGTYYVLDPVWKFTDDDGFYAVNQYGCLAKFTYFDASAENMLGVNFEILDTTQRDLIDSYYGNLKNNLYCVKDNYLYLYGKGGIVKVYDINDNYKPVGKYSTGVTYEESNTGIIYRITVVDNNLYINYYVQADGKKYDKIISLDNFEEYQNIWVKDFKTQSNTQSDISTKYNEAKKSYDYSQGLFEIEPTWSAPYRAGKLKQGPIDDTLKQINFFRWMYGVNEVTVNTDKLERSQKGAVVQAATNELTHTPSQPADMDDDFYSEAYAACNIGYTDPNDYYNGNCAQGDSNPADTIAGFIDEIYNVSPNSSVGHRLNLLDLDVDRVSFGYCNTFTALSMYYNYGALNNNDDFYLYPTAGNFPKQLFKTNQHLSVLCNGSYNFNEVKVDIKYNEETYENIDYHMERDNVIVFMFPDELITALGGSYREIPESTLNVKITGLKKSNGDTINLDYDVKFYDVNNPEDDNDILLGDVDKNGVVNSTDCTLILRYLKGYENLDEEQLILADVDKNDTVNSTDCTLILRYLKGYENLQ